MKRHLAIAAMLTTALIASSPAQAASYQDRAMTTGAVFGGATGAAIGSNSNRAVEGAIFGAVLGTIAGIIIADQQRPAAVVYARHRPVVRRHHAYRQHHAYRVAERRAHLRHDRYVARGYGHHRNGSHWSDYRAARHHDRGERSNRRSHREDNDS